MNAKFLYAGQQIVQVLEQVKVGLVLLVPIPPWPVKGNQDTVAAQPLEKGGVSTATWEWTGGQMDVGCPARQIGPLGQVRAEAGPDAAVEGAAGVGVLAFEVDDLSGMVGKEGARFVNAVGTAAVWEVEGA